MDDNDAWICRQTTQLSAGQGERRQLRGSEATIRPLDMTVADCHLLVEDLFNVSEMTDVAGWFGTI